MPNPIERAVAKGTGAAKGLAAHTKGLSGVFVTLAKQHGEASALLERAQGSDDPSKQRELWLELRAELLSHERAELSAVYPELERHAELRPLVEKHQGEARELEAAITRVDSAEPGSPGWKSSLQTLSDRVLDHAHREESEFFPRAVEILDDATIEALDSRYRSAQTTAKEPFGKA